MAEWALHIVFRCPTDCAVAAETLAAVLDDLGALGWHEMAIGATGEAALCAFFPVSAQPDSVSREVRRAAELQQAEGLLQASPRLSVEAVAPVDWVAEYRRGFRGVQVAPGLRVVPPCRAKAKSEKVRRRATEIVILPGMAFGSGLHETTRLCLRLLRREIHGGERVADLGAGSGILSIAAVLFGARSAVAIESDPQAYENLLENIRLNQLGRRVRLFRGDAAQAVAELERHRRAIGRRVGFDLIVCNILFEKMQPLLGYFRTLARPGDLTSVITSGHLWSEREEAVAALAAAGVRIRYERQLGDWGSVVGRISL